MMEEWVSSHEVGNSYLDIWEFLVKPGIRRLVRERQGELQKMRRDRLMVLFAKQGRYTDKLHNRDFSVLPLLRATQLEIANYYKEESAKIILQA